MEVLAWQFLPYDGRLRKPLPDGTRPRITAGWSYHTERTIEMHWRQLEAYPRPLDAFLHGAGPVACQVALSGTIFEHTWLPRLSATDLTVVNAIDAMILLDRFALDLAERTLLRERIAGREPPHTLWDMLALRQERLRAGTDAMQPYQQRGRFSLFTREQWEAEPEHERLPWHSWHYQKQLEWARTLEGWISVAVEEACFRNSQHLRYPFRRWSIKAAIRAGQLSRALWSEEEEAAAVAAGLRVQADEVNAELEARLIASLM